MLQIALLGSPDVLVDGAPMEVDTRKALAILAYLARESGRHPRDTLVDLLWPDTDVDRARSSLRRTLSTLRSGLGGRWVDADRSVVALDRTGVTVDVDEFLALADDLHGHGRGDTCAVCLRDLPRAVDLLRGDFMAGFGIRDAAPFETWMTTQAEHLRGKADEVHARLAAARAAEGDYPGAIASAGARIALDPLNEEAHRSLMLLTAWAGDRSGAVDAYRRLVGILDTELGVPPLETTTELYEAILEEDLPRAPAPVPRPMPRLPRPAAAPMPFVGRDAELSVALDALTDPGGIVKVRGVAGIGVTRLLAEVAGRLRSDGALVLAAAGSAATGAVPYGVIHEALAPALADPTLSARWQGLPEGVLAEAARIYPGLTTHPPAASATRTRLLDALSQIVATLPDPVLVIDDAHRCDGPSAEAIAFLAARAEHNGIRIAIGVTDGETPSPEVAALIVALGRRGTVIDLDPLPESAVIALAAALGAVEAGPDLARRSGGLPLFVVESIRVGGDGVSDQIRRVIRDRVAGLDGGTVQVLDTIAILGRPELPGTVAAISGRSLDETDQALDILIGRGLAAESEDGSVAVTHGMLAEVVVAGLTAARRRLLNRRAAATLAAEDADASRVARHHQAAGDDAGAAHWFARAGTLASAVFAHGDAIAAFDAALGAGHPDRAEIHAAIGDAALRDGRYDRAVVEFEAALAAGHADIAGIEHRLGEVHRRLQRWELAEAHYVRAGEAAASEEIEAIVAADRAYVEYRRGRDPAPLVERARSLADRSGSSRAIARAENVAGLVAPDTATRVARLRTALDHATDPAERVAVLNNLAGSVPAGEAVALARRALEIAVELGDRHLMAALHNTLADALHAAGESAASMAALTQAVSLFTEISRQGDDEWTPEVWLLTEW